MATSRSQHLDRKYMLHVQIRSPCTLASMNNYLVGWAKATHWPYSYVQQLATGHSFLLSVSGDGDLIGLREQMREMKNATIHIFDTAGQYPVLYKAICYTECPHWLVSGSNRPFMEMDLDEYSCRFLASEAARPGRTYFYAFYHIVEYRSIVATNLSKQLQDDRCKKGDKEIAQLMRGIGPVVKIDWKLNDKKTTAIIHFSTHEEAERAISMYHGRSWMGRELQLRPDKDTVSGDAPAAMPMTAAAAASGSVKGGRSGGGGGGGGAAAARVHGPAIANGSNWGEPAQSRSHDRRR